MWNSVLAVWRKELLDGLRDKRALKLAFLPPVYMVLFFSLGILFAIYMQSDEARKLELTVSGEAPDLVAWLEENQVDIERAEGDAYELVEQGDKNLVLVLPQTAPDPGDKTPLPVTLVYNASNQKVHGPLGQVRQLIYQYSSRRAAINVMARGISSELIQPVRIKESNIASEREMGGLILGSVPMLLLMCAVIGSVGFASDMTAGERERRSLEPLLINPTPSGVFMLGKWLAAVALTLAVIVLCLVLLGVALALLPFNEMGFRVAVSPLALVQIFWALVPVAMIAAGLQLALGILSRSFKDAQTFMGFLVLLPMIPFFVVITNPGLYADWHLWVPMLGHQTVLKDLLLGQGAPDWAFTAFWVSGVPVAGGAVWLAARQLRRASIVYG